MHSSTSSSSWIKGWIFGIIATVVVLSGLEVIYRAWGHVPSVVDDKRLWSSERSRVGRSDKEIVLIGASRMQTDISTNTIRRLLPDYNIINLSVVGSCGNATLRDLGKDRHFNGIALCEITEHCIVFGHDAEVGKIAYPDYYHSVFTFTDQVNREISTWFQKRLTLINPYLYPISVLRYLAKNGKMLPPNYVTTYEDRSRSADYSKLDIVRHRAERVRRLGRNLEKGTSKMSEALFHERVAELEASVTQIHSRNGKVVYLRFPVSGEHWDWDERFWPKSVYWDSLESHTIADVIHFKNIESMASLICPDTSHLDAKDTVLFTNLLFQELAKRKII